ncbi:hypothetical protein C8F04DRAFT_1395375 [Mycena alexandri]|uniref:F-box domain-containing protein n=1 Tax=Mycena alexandri TaxID=1745969 RepID=A0AAD6SVF6_9AGAR|nr:hypothetical protein C8F04DRAFT_1395375 [Mycena alexandri]
MDQRNFEQPIALRHDPKFVPLLRSGRIPSPQDRDNLKGLLKEVENGITRDENAICDLEYQVELLQHRVSVLEENKRLLKSLSAPIRQAPPEIIQQILELSVGVNHFGGTKPISPATRVASVCAQWRSIAQATPCIWARFLVEIPSGDPRKQESLVKSIERHLAFARDAELEIDLRAVKRIVVDDKILGLFAARATRWRSATFKLGYLTNGAQEILNTTLDHLPSLKSLHIYCPPGSNTDIQVEFFKCCPALRQLSLSKFNPQAMTTIPWAQLTSINFAPVDARDIDNVLEVCPRLVSVSLRVETASGLETNGPTLVPRTHQMHSLRIESTSASSAYNAHPGVFSICTALTLPHLESLVVGSNMIRKYVASDESRHEAGKWPQTAVVEMLTRSKCKLKTLRLKGVPLDTTEVLQLLRLAPHAVEVSLHECRTRDPELLSDQRSWVVFDDVGANHFITKDLLLELCAQKPAQSTNPTLSELYVPLLPRLRRFHLKVNSGFDMDTYMRMVRSRWPEPGVEIDSNVSRLAAISLAVMCHNDDYGHWDSKPLLAMKKEGLLIKYDDGGEEFYDYHDQVKSYDDSDSEYYLVQL